MENFFDDKKWSGQFFYPEKFEDRFSGEAKFSFEDGLSLSYMWVGPQQYEETQLLHGVLSSGDRCTLTGTFPPGRPGANIRNGLVTRHGSAPFSFLVIGAFLEENVRIDRILFSVTGLQDFFNAGRAGSGVRFSTDPVYTMKTKFGKIEVRHAATFLSAPEDLASHFYSSKPNELAALEEKFSELKKDFPESRLMIKKDLTYRFALWFDEPCDIDTAYQHIKSISDLFSLLAFEPVFHNQIECHEFGADERTYLKIYPHTTANRRTIEMCKSSVRRGRLPIKHSDIQFESVLANWLASSRKYAVIVSGVQSQTGLTTLHETLGEIVLYSTQLEAISHDANEKKKKYEYPLRRFGDQIIHAKLQILFNSSGASETAIAIADLRNEIAHVGRPKKWLENFDLHDLIEISQCLQAIVIAYSMDKIGIPTSTAFHYQRQIIPT